MTDKHYSLRPDQAEFLSSLPGNASEHLRQAIDDYKLKKDKENMNLSESKS